MKKTLAKEVFTDATGDSDIPWKIYQSRPKSLEDAVSIAVVLEVSNLAEQKKGAQKRPGVRVLSDEKTETERKANTEPTGGQGDLAAAMLKGFADMTQQLTDLLSNGSQRNSKVGNKNKQNFGKCYNCGEVGHFKRDFPHPK